MRNYGVLKAKVFNIKRDDDDKPHSELHVKVGKKEFRIAVNVRSSRGPEGQRLIEFLLDPDFSHPTLDAARLLPNGWNDLEDGQDDEASLDYVRSNLFRAEDMKPITHMAPGPNNDLFEYLEYVINRAMQDKSAVVYAFGERWGPKQGEDEIFKFKPSDGVHMIHMN